MSHFNQKVINNGDNQRKLFLGGLSPNTTEVSLRSFYGQFGELADVIVMRDQSTGRSRGFGFITFKEPESVDRVQAVRPHIINGKPVDSKRVLPPAESSGKNVGNNSGRKVFVGGLKAVHDEQSIREHFQQFGNILGIRILVDKNTGRKRGFGYVEYEDYDSADKAALYNNHTIKYISVDVKKSTYKPETNKKFEKPKENNKKDATSNEIETPLQGAYPPGPYPLPYGFPPAPGYNGWGPPSCAPYSQQQPAYGGPPPPVWNGWGYSAPAAVEQPLEAHRNYKQSYNGGPQKDAKLQGYRSRPYPG